MSKPDGLRKPGRRNGMRIRVSPSMPREEANRADSRTSGHGSSDLPATDELEANTAEQSKAGPDKLRDTVGAFSRKAAGTVAEATAAAAVRVQDASSKVVSATDSLSQECATKNRGCDGGGPTTGGWNHTCVGGNRLGCKPVDGRLRRPSWPASLAMDLNDLLQATRQGQCHDL